MQNHNLLDFFPWIFPWNFFPGSWNFPSEFFCHISGIFSPKFPQNFPKISPKFPLIFSGIFQGFLQGFFVLSDCFIRLVYPIGFFIDHFFKAYLIGFFQSFFPVVFQVFFRAYCFVVFRE